MKINICILDAESKIKTKQWTLIKNVVRRHSERACKKLSLTTMNVSVYPNKEWCINQTGDGGYTASLDWIQLFIDPSKPLSIPRIIKQSFPANIYHEMHHARRMIKAGFGENLLETVISEGMAIVFAEEMFNKFKAPWAKYSKSEIKKLYKIFDAHKLDEVFNYKEWFLGHGKPHWLGYKVGAYIIRELKSEDDLFTCDKMVDVPAINIYNKWLNLNKAKK